ncbi:alanine dehydrogenase [Kribbella sp. NPDC050820]|uniref:alanine dehydrogenase n=1 Tax=Kribbella sp. NPDC050820 TaxID=3155408 RepID=UPI0033E7F522
MRISAVKEIKTKEARVGLTPAGVAVLVADGHNVFVEHNAGTLSGFSNDEYERAGAKLVDQAEAWANAELLVKVKEPVSAEYGFLRDDLTLFAYLHLAADRPLTEALLNTKTLGIAYETVQDHTGLPLLTPMSEIAGRLAAHAAATYLAAPEGGPGRLVGGSPGVVPCRVVVIGGGVVGTQAALLALGMQAEVTVVDTSATRIRELGNLLDGRARVVMSDPATLARELIGADVVIGAVLVPGQAAPKVVSRTDLALLPEGALLIDVAIDQGGCFETSRPTTYANPTYEIDGIRHYCVANMPGGVPQTSTRALTNATFPYLRRLAKLGPADALAADPALALGLNTQNGLIMHKGVADALPDLPNA